MKVVQMMLIALLLISGSAVASPFVPAPTGTNQADRLADPSGSPTAGDGIPLRSFVPNELDEMMGDTLLISTTWRDQLGTSSNTRFLAYTEDDPNYPQGVVKLTWQEHATSGGTRLTHFILIYENEDGELEVNGLPSDVGGSADGYPVLDVDSAANPFVGLHSQHQLEDGLWDSAVMRESQWVSGFFDYQWVARYNNTAQAVWPSLALQEVDDNLYAHTLNFASEDGNPFDKYTFYNRMQILSTDEDPSYVNATPGTNPQMIATQYNEDVEGIVAANDESGVVAVVLPISRHLKDGEDNGFYENHRIAQTCNDVYLYTSDDGGATWDWENGLNITDFIDPNLDLIPGTEEDTLAANGDTLRVYADVNCVVDNEGIVHVTFTTPFIDFVRSEGESSFSGRLWYWNSRDSLCIQMQEKIWNGVVPGAWQTFTNQCQLGVDENTGWVWAAWSQYGEVDDTLHYTEDGEEYWTPVDFAQSTGSTGGNFALGDIYVSVSPDGLRWAKPVNVTNTRDTSLETALAGGLAAGDCRSEVHPSLAEDVSGEYLHLFYLQDRDGGRSYTWEEGVETEGELIYQRVLKSDVIAVMNEQAEWIRNYPIHVDSTDYYVDPNDWAWDGLVPNSAPEERTLAPDQFELDQNYPNPFNPSTQISFNLQAAGKVKLAVYDVLGREVATLVNRPMSSGRHTISFLGSDLASGVYFYKLTSGESSKVRKMILMK